MSGSYFQPIKREFLNLSGGTVTGETAFTSGLTIINGNVGIGTATPETTLQVLAPTALLAEEISRFGVSGVTGSSVSIINATSASGQFTPAVLSINSETNRHAFLFYGAGGLDTGTIAISTFDSRIVTSGSAYPNYGWSAATTRPLFRWANNGSAQMTMSANGNLGIGTATPTAKLHINNTTTGTTFLAEDSSNPNATPFIIDTDGNVGIGTATPTEKLEVNGAYGRVFNRLDTTGTTSVTLTGQSSGITVFEAGSTDVGHIYMGVRGKDNTLNPGFGKVGDSFVYSSIASNGLNILSANGVETDDYIRFYAGRLYVSGSTILTPDIHIQGSGSTRGNIGIGTANPTQKLHISGNTRVLVLEGSDHVYQEFYPQSMSGGRFGWIGYGSSGTTDFRIWNQPIGGRLLFGTENSLKMTINGDGNVGIGVGAATPTAKLHINNNTTGATFLVEDSSNPDSTPFIIDTSGNVGIGTTTPSTLLDVQGSNSTYFRFSPTTSGGRVLLSGATGTTSSPAYVITVPISSGSSLTADAQFGIISFENTSNLIFGKPGDTYIRSSSRSNGLNLITEPLAGTGTTEDYIRFYAGQNASGTTPDIHIQGTGTTRGFVGIGTATPNRPLHVRDVMRLEPRSTDPSDPAEGDIYFDSTLKKLRVFDGTTWQNCW